MTDSTHTDPEYIVEFADGPLAGQTDRRFLVDGQVDERIGVVAAVEGLESTFWYIAGDERSVGEQKHVTYHFDAPDSDPVEADQEDESIYGYGA